MPLMHFNAETWPAVSALLDEALALPADARETWLQSLQGERAAHRDTLRDLLSRAAGVETEDFLATLPRFTQLAPANLRGPLTELAAGDSIGPYRLLSELGTGGMGAVWLAERSDGQLKRKVALKLPRLVWARGLAERMARERDILASLEHANIARLYDAGVDQHGRPYLALEYVEGQPIDVYARERALGVKDKLQLLLQVCSAVAFAHSRLVVHRDLKPSNILVTADGQVRLLDFGIAKLMEGDSAKETQLTQLAGRALTLDYASPEQIKGEPIGTASDVYSLGVVAYELLTGARPYKLKRGSAAELEEAIATADAPKASDSAQDDQTRKALKGDLDAILNKALKRALNERYASVEALALDLRRYCEGAPVHAMPDSLTYRLRKLVARRRLETAIVVGAVIALVGGAHGQVAVAAALTFGALIGTWQFRKARAAAAAAAEERNRALLEVATNREVTQFVVSLFAVPNPPDIEIVDRGLHRVRATEGGSATQLRARLTKVLGDLYYNIGRYGRAVEVHREAAELALSPEAPDFRTAAAALAAQGLDHHYLGEDAKGRSCAAQALAVIAQHKLDEVWLRADACTAMGVTLTSLREYESARPYVHDAVRLNQELVGPHGRRTLAARGDEARLASAAGEYGQADVLYRRLIRDIEAKLGVRDSLYMLALQNFGNLLVRMGKPAEAEARLRDAVNLREMIYGPTHPASANTYALLGGALLRAGKPDEAITAYEKALSASLSSTATPTPLQGSFCRNLWQAELHCGRTERANERFAQALAVLRPDEAASLRAERIATLIIANAFDEAMAEAELLRTAPADQQRALALLQLATQSHGDRMTSIQRLDELMTSNPRDVINAALRLTQARLARQCGELALAHRHYRQALGEARLADGRVSPLWTQAAGEWGQVLAELGMVDEREQLLASVAR